MPKFAVTVEEIVIHEYQVEASDEPAAMKAAEERFNQGDLGDVASLGIEAFTAEDISHQFEEA